jgi:hypothetical protein
MEEGNKFHHHVSTFCLHHVAEKSWQTDNKRTELPLPPFPSKSRHPHSSREHMSEEQARYIPSCAMMKVEKQADGLAPQITGGNKPTEK